MNDRQRQVARELNPMRVAGFLVEGDGSPQNTRVYFEGEELSGVQSVDYHMGVGRHPDLTITVTGGPDRRKKS